jgi:GNAT superfamily N-acetyltransferase
MCSHHRYKPGGYSREFRVPGLLIGQLGVDAQFERNNIGSMLIDYCISLAMEIKRYAACRIIYVESFDDAVEFYKKPNFVLLDDNIKNRNKMILDMKLLACDFLEHEHVFAINQFKVHSVMKP